MNEKLASSLARGVDPDVSYKLETLKTKHRNNTGYADGNLNGRYQNNCSNSKTK